MSRPAPHGGEPPMPATVAPLLPEPDPLPPAPATAWAWATIAARDLRGPELDAGAVLLAVAWAADNGRTTTTAGELATRTGLAPIDVARLVRRLVDAELLTPAGRARYRLPAPALVVDVEVHARLVGASA